MLDPTVTSDPAAIPLPARDTEPDTGLDLDLRGLRCPLPVLRTRKALAGLPSGALLCVSCTDPLAGLDIPHLVHEIGDVMVHIERAGEVHLFTIRKS